jgi:uncharacterized membrane protein
MFFSQAIINWQPFAGLLAGWICRTIVPYLVAGFETVREKHDWKAWPAFDPEYLAGLGLTVLAFLVALAITPGLFERVNDLAFVTAAALAYLGQDFARQGQKAYQAARNK